MMHRSGNYRKLNLIFGLFPFVAAILLSLMRDDSPPAQLWLSIVRRLFSSVDYHNQLSSILADSIGIR